MFRLHRLEVHDLIVHPRTSHQAAIVRLATLAAQDASTGDTFRGSIPREIRPASAYRADPYRSHWVSSATSSTTAATATASLVVRLSTAVRKAVQARKPKAHVVLQGNHNIHFSLVCFHFSMHYSSMPWTNSIARRSMTG